MIELKAELPGQILELLVAVGDKVEKEQPVLILDAMKMENEVFAPTNGTIKEIFVKAGDNVMKDHLFLTID